MKVYHLGSGVVLVEKPKKILPWLSIWPRSCAVCSEGDLKPETRSIQVEEEDLCI